MTSLTQELIDLVKTTLVDPRQAARTLLGRKLPKDTLWTAALLVVIASTLLTYITLAPAAGPMPGWLSFASSPFILALFMAANIVIMIFALFWTGKALGGQGSLEGFIALMTWLQAMMVLIEIAQIILSLFSIALASLLGLAAIAWWVWATVLFTTEGHQFDHWGKGVVAIGLAVLGMVAGLSLLLSLMGAGMMGVTGSV